MSEFLKWNKKEHDWDIQKRSKRDDKFFKCYYCGKGNTKFDQKFNGETGQFESKDWRCLECSKALKFEKLSKVTRNFITNVFLKELNFILDNPVKMLIKVKKGTEVDLKMLGPEVGIKSKSEHISYICGKCKNKNQFVIKNYQRKLYQCSNCGFFNILE